MKKAPRKTGLASETAATYGEPHVKIAELKAHLSRHLQAVREGGQVVVLDRKTPIARIVPFAPHPGSLVVRRATKTWAQIAPLLGKLKLGKLKTDPVDLIRELRRDRV